MASRGGRRAILQAMLLVLSSFAIEECMSVVVGTHRWGGRKHGIEDKTGAPAKPASKKAGHGGHGGHAGHAGHAHAGKKLDCSEITKKTPISLKAYAGEFGEEVLMAIPFAYTFRRCGMLASTTSCGNMSAFYWFSPNHTNLYKCERKTWGNKFVKGGGKEIAWGQFFKGYTGDWWLPPPHLEFFNQKPALPSKGSFVEGQKQLVIINKYESEWGEPPVNFLSMETVQSIIDSFNDACGDDARTLYINDDASAGDQHHGMAIDSQEEESLAAKKDTKITTQDGTLDIDWVRQAGNAEVIQDVYEQYPHLSANEVKLRMLSRAKCFVSVQGGTGTFAFMFGGHSLVFQKRGHESGRFYNVVAPKYSGQNVEVFGNYGLLLSKFNSTFLADACSACSVRGSNDTLPMNPEDKEVMLQAQQSKRELLKTPVPSSFIGEGVTRVVVKRADEGNDEDSGADMEGSQHVLHKSSHSSSSHSSHHRTAKKADDDEGSGDLEGSQHVLRSKHHAAQSKLARGAATMLDDVGPESEEDPVDEKNAFTRKSIPGESLEGAAKSPTAVVHAATKKTTRDAAQLSSKIIIRADPLGSDAESNDRPQGARRMSTAVHTSNSAAGQKEAANAAAAAEVPVAKHGKNVVENIGRGAAAELASVEIMKSMKPQRKPVLAKDLLKKAKNRAEQHTS